MLFIRLMLVDYATFVEKTLLIGLRSGVVSNVIMTAVTNVSKSLFQLKLSINRGYIQQLRPQRLIN